MESVRDVPFHDILSNAEWSRRMLYETDDTLCRIAIDSDETIDILRRIEHPAPRGFSVTLDNHRSQEEYDRIRMYCKERGLELLPLSDVIGRELPYTHNTYAIGKRLIEDEQMQQDIATIISAYRGIDGNNCV